MNEISSETATDVEILTNADASSDDTRQETANARNNRKSETTAPKASANRGRRGNLRTPFRRRRAPAEATEPVMEQRLKEDDQTNVDGFDPNPTAPAPADSGAAPTRGRAPRRSATVRRSKTAASAAPAAPRDAAPAQAQSPAQLPLYG